MDKSTKKVTQQEQKQRLMVVREKDQVLHGYLADIHTLLQNGLHTVISDSYVGVDFRMHEYEMQN